MCLDFSLMHGLSVPGTYSKFLSSEFDVNGEASTLLQSAALSEQLAHITKGKRTELKYMHLPFWSCMWKFVLSRCLPI